MKLKFSHHPPPDLCLFFVESMIFNPGPYLIGLYSNNCIFPRFYMHYVIESICLLFVAFLICILVLKIRIVCVLLINAFVSRKDERTLSSTHTMVDPVFPVDFILYHVLFSECVHLCGYECGICWYSESFYEYICFFLLDKYA